MQTTLGPKPPERRAQASGQRTRPSRALSRETRRAPTSENCGPRRRTFLRRRPSGALWRLQRDHGRAITGSSSERVFPACRRGEFRPPPCGALLSCDARRPRNCRKSSNATVYCASGAPRRITVPSWNHYSRVLLPEIGIDSAIREWSSAPDPALAEVVRDALASSARSRLRLPPGPRRCASPGPQPRRVSGPRHSSHKGSSS